MNDARLQRGQVIAQSCTIRQRGHLHFVPSQSGNGTSYAVDYKRNFCSCPDHAETGLICKHLHAVRITLTKTEKHADGSATVSTLSVEAKVERPTYRQDWTNYNRAQTSEHRHFQTLLSELCRTISVPAPKRGKPAINPRDAAFSSILKVRSTLSARRFVGELDECRDCGFIGSVPHFNSVLKFFETEAATPILERFVWMSASPLAEIETDFAVDSTGFSGCRYLQWIDEKYGVPRRKVDWVKVHAMIGVKTNCIAAVKILGQNTPDGKQLPDLVRMGAEHFTVREVSADKAYTSRYNFDAVESVGGTFYPAFKRNANGNVGGAFGRAFHLMQLNREEYELHYHKRSNAESAFSSIKRTLGADLKAKTPLAMKNECLAKIVAYNIRCVIHSMYELGISPFMDGCTQNDEPAHIIRFPGA